MKLATVVGPTVKLPPVTLPYALLTYTALVAAMPPGTVTVSEVAVAAVTVAAVPPEPPNLTVFDAGVVWKLVPVMVMLAPMLPVVGVNDEMSGPRP